MFCMLACLFFRLPSWSGLKCNCSTVVLLDIAAAFTSSARCGAAWLAAGAGCGGSCHQTARLACAARLAGGRPDHHGHGRLDAHARLARHVVVLHLEAVLHEEAPRHLPDERVAARAPRLALGVLVHRLEGEHARLERREQLRDLVEREAVDDIFICFSFRGWFCFAN